MRKTLAESPTGLVHIVQILPSNRVKTMCGRDVDKATWTRIRQLDKAMYGKGKSTIAKMIELPTCERCF